MKVFNPLTRPFTCAALAVVVGALPLAGSASADVMITDFNDDFAVPNATVVPAVSATFTDSATGNSAIHDYCRIDRIGFEFAYPAGH